MARKVSKLEESYDIVDSPFSQKLTHGKLADLLGMKPSKLKGLVKYKDSFVVSREEEIGGKTRNLIYPTGELKICNQAIVRILNRISLPNYYLSPRCGKSIFDNAALHGKSSYFYKLDIRQFYPSVSRQRVYKFFVEEFGMYSDVANTLTELLTYENSVFFGGPATPRLVALIFREMFDEIDRLAISSQGIFSVWVDNMVLSSSNKIPYALDEMFAVLNRHGMRGHQASAHTHFDRHLVTGIGIHKHRTFPRNSHNLRIKELEDLIHTEKDPQAWDKICLRLLSAYGIARKSLSGNPDRLSRIDQRMDSLRKRRRSLVVTG